MKYSDHYDRSKVKVLELLMGDGWTIEPAGGSSGEAYLARAGEQVLFLKRNSSPFLAVLSAEGIVPKLLWTKRQANGDVITAQRWVDGRELTGGDMDNTRVAQLLSKIHSSSELLDMFMRIGNHARTPEATIAVLKEQQEQLPYITTSMAGALEELAGTSGEVQPPRLVVCHGDMNHNNWMFDANGDLYLVDWDNATVSDPALDLALILYEYIPREEWDGWLQGYGLSLTSHLLRRMRWQIISHLLDHAQQAMLTNRIKEAEFYKKQLEAVLDRDSLQI
ncbi:phosphotransferase family protein [Marinococcus sp. PL1-022]|jgi:thiamine kinase-like enzyme|uniref:phosphotransferase family protein n=1 Tax=Marinococcus sp. PL1-022 TaxID=3095363 RepID=UPI002620AA27|nr:phosphotransferase family protein [Marinococcus sp. PL1-022]MDX6151956.1 phosphotransferase family protein [Marinococcus sp. PL1-022]